MMMPSTTSARGAMACPMCELHAESVFTVDGMDCLEEATIIERRLVRLEGFESLSADLVRQRVRVKHDAAKLSAARIAEAVAQTGMRAWLEQDHPSTPPLASAFLRQTFLVASGFGLASALMLRIVDVGAWAVRPLLASAIVAGSVFVIRRAYWAARSLSLDINVLMLVAVVGAVAIGEWFEGAAVIFLYALAQQLESRSMEHARGAIRALMELSPLEALVRRGGSEHRVSVDDVHIGEHIVIHPGEKVPLDGIVTTGRSHINQAPLTGESFPIDKGPGDEVFAGTINGRGALEVRVTRPGRDTRLARISHLVERAQAQRAPTQAFVDTFAKYYTPAVIALAVSIATVPPLIVGQPFGAWVYRALVLLVIACPCALVISTPVAIVSALAGAARRGVLIKGGVHLERTAGVRCVAFDKTGTLTQGRMQVAEIVPVNGVSPSQILGIAAALESRSEHPIARAIVQRAASEGVEILPGQECQALPGRGAEGLIGGSTAVIGSHRLFHERHLCSSTIDARLEALSSRGSTPVLVALGGRTVGIIGVSDVLRDTSRAVADLLRAQGVAHLALLTGDSRHAAEAVARTLGFDEVRAELLPEDKLSAIAELRARYGPVVMIGDGVNDAPALAAADVGIAMGAAGTDAALETADVALMADELVKIPYAVRLSQATRRIIRTNLTLSLGLKAAFLAMAVTGYATLWMAVAADMGASLLVVGNGLRLLRVR